MADHVYLFPQGGPGGTLRARRFNGPDMTEVTGPFAFEEAARWHVSDGAHLMPTARCPKPHRYILGVDEDGEWN